MGITQEEAFEKGYGSEGICAHCKHRCYCVGSTVVCDPKTGYEGQTGARYECHGVTTWYPACSNGAENEIYPHGHEVFEEE